MARKISFLASLLALATWILLLPVGVRSIEWNSVDVCNTTIPASCHPTDPTHIWTVRLDCSQPDAVTVRYSGYRGPLGSPLGDIGYAEEIRLECTDGNVQVERQVNCSTYETGTPSVGPYTFKSLSASGILPGWKCTITGCFNILLFQPDIDGNDELFVHTPAKNFVLPQCASGDSCTCTDGVSIADSTTAVMPDTTTPTTSDVTTIVDGETTEALPATTMIIPSATERTRDETATSSSIAAEGTTADSIPLPTVVKTDADPDITENEEKDLFVTSAILIPLIMVLTMLITTVLFAIIIIGWMKQRKDRKVLLVIDKRNMIFDPTYSPAICIDKPDLSLSHRISVVSTAYLQYLEPTQNLGFHGGYQVSSDPFCSDVSPEVACTPLSKAPFGDNLKKGDIAMDTDDCSKEFPRNSDYILNESRFVTMDDATNSSTDSTSEPIQDYGSDSPPLEYVHGNHRNPNILSGPSENGVRFHESLQGNEQESMSDDAMSILLSEESPSKNIGFTLDQHYSSSGSDYVQSNAPNAPVPPKENPDNNMPTNSVLELDLELSEEQLLINGYQPQPMSMSPATGHHETTAYVESEQFSSQNTQTVQCKSQKEAKFDDLDFSDSYSLDSSVLTQSLCSTVATPPGGQETYNPQQDLSNMDGYVQNEPEPFVSTTVMQDTEGIELNFDSEYEIDSSELIHNEEELQDQLRPSMDKNLDLSSQVDLPSTPPTTSSSRGYVTFEDNTALTSSEPFTREITHPVADSITSPSKTKPNLMIHLDFDENNPCQYPIVLESLCSGLSKDHQHWQCPSGSTGYVANESSVTQTVKKGQYISYDFVPLTAELRRESSNCLAENQERTDIFESPNRTGIDIDTQSNYYPSDISSGYLSGSSVAGDAKTYYLGEERLS